MAERRLENYIADLPYKTAKAKRLLFRAYERQREAMVEYGELVRAGVEELAANKRRVELQSKADELFRKAKDAEEQAEFERKLKEATRRAAMSPVAKENPAAFAHARFMVTKDRTAVVFNGKPYPFSRRQIEALDYINRRGPVKWPEIRTHVEKKLRIELSPDLKLHQLFKDNPHWSKIVKAVGRGLYMIR